MIAYSGINVDTEQDIEKLRQLCRLLTVQNIALMNEISSMKSKVQEYEARVTQLLAELSRTHSIEEQNSKLMLLVEELKKENELLKMEKNEMIKDIDSLKLENKQIQGEILKLKMRDDPITVRYQREAMRALENSICLEASGSKNKYKKYYNFAKLAVCPEQDIQARYQQILQKLNLTPDHINEIVYLKDNGDTIAHDNRPVLTFREWESVLLDEGTEQDDIIVRNGLLSALKNYYPIQNETDPWKIQFKI